jgi:hypothetical protein
MPKRDDRRVKKAPTKKSQAGGGPPLAPADEREPGRLAGKRFSRVRIIGRGTVWFGVGPDGKLSDEQSQQLKRLRAGARSDDYAELVAAFKAKAAEAADFLRERGLPGTPNVLTLKEGDEWSDDAIEYDCEVYMASVRAGWPPGSVETVDHYLIEYKGFDPDSPEALAARVLIWTQAFECRGPLTKDAVVAAYRLGELSALERAYSIDRDRAQKPKPRQQAEKWREFARMLIRQDPGRSPEHYWESLTDETREFGSADIYRDGETLVWSEGGKVTPIQYRTFRRHVERAQADWRSKKAHRRADGLAT